MVGGSQPPKSNFRYEEGEGLIRLIQIRDYKSDANKVYIPIDKAKRFVDVNDVMIGRYGPPIFQILRGLTGAYNVALMKAVPTAEIFDNDYLYRYLSNQDLYNYVESASDRTAGQSGVNKAHLEKYPVGLPPLAEQKQIAARLDALLAQVDTLKTRLDAIPTILKRFRQSVLAAAVSGKLTEVWRGAAELSGWRTKTIKNVIISLNQGWSPKCLNCTVNDSEWGVIKTSSIQELYFVKSENKKLPDNLEPRAELSVAKNDILITRAGPRSRCGVTCIVESDYPKLMICDKVYRIRVDNSKIHPNFLNYLLNSASLLFEIEKIKTGTSENGMNLTQKKFIDLHIKLPPIREQTEIALQVDQLFAFADQIEQRVAEAKKRVDHLTQSILAKAFRGDLTAEWRAQNPDLISGENSAEALLARIRAERAVASASPARKPGKRRSGA